MREQAIALNRFGLGARRADSMPASPKRWLLDQFARFDPRPGVIAALPGSRAMVAMFDAARRDQREAKAALPMVPASDEDPKPEQRAARPYRGLRDQHLAGANARITVAVASTAPLVERLVHFWSNHFALSIDKLAALGLAAPFEFEAIRPHVLGSFANLLLAAVRHPGMLLYLDQAQSIGPESALGRAAARRSNRRGLNENLAREVLELHTLGVRTGYSQADVTELARALTGWTVGGLARMPQLRGPSPGYFFLEAIHEPGVRRVMGRSYAQRGQAQAEAILRDLAVHPATARHLAVKLARHFAADAPPESLIVRLETAFLASGGDLPTVYRALIEAPEPWANLPKFRTPWDWTLAALRAVGTEALPNWAGAAALNQLGQPVWKPGSPAGWDDTAPSWAGPDALFRRVEVAERIARRTGVLDARGLAEHLFPGVLSATTRAALANAESPNQALALLLASPEMMRR